MATPPRRPFRRRIILNTASTGAANLWAIVVAVVTLPLLLHGLGAQAFGTWVLLQTFSAITGWFSLVDLGVGTATTRSVAERASLDDEHGVRTVTASSMSLYLGLGVVCATGLLFAGQHWLPSLFNTPLRLRADLRVAIALFSAQLVLDLLTEGAEACLEGLQRVDLSRGVDAVRRTLVAGATAAVALQGGGLRGVAAASLATSAVGTIAGLALLLKLVPSGRFRPSGTEARALMAYGRTVAVLRPLGVIQRTMDRLIVGAALGPASVSLVEIATQVMNGADAILSASSYTVVPGASWLRARGDRHSLRELFLSGTKYSLLVTYPVIALVSVLAGPLILLWVGPHYHHDAPGLVVVALLAIAMSAPLQVGSNLLLGVGKAGEILRAAALAVAVNLVASVILVNAIGVVGVFVGTIIGNLFLIPPLGRSALREVEATAGEFIHRSLMPSVLPVIVLLVVAGVVVVAPLGDLLTAVLGAGLGGIAYVATTYRFSMRPGELAELKDTVFGRE
jgi:O-antigen/teichoic acid export membrane protein